MSKLEVIQPEILSLIQNIARGAVAQLGLSLERVSMMPFSVGDKVRLKSVSLKAFTQQGGQRCPNWK
ncbi:MAG: hypothetical protein ACJAZP_003561 [Psychromonas sp.]|jgi:hypothetical protein|uniref:hypothetical protein n=1 Tax=Psychromonas sp. TaxID=1884585 RepID=UPI0039E4287E